MLPASSCGLGGLAHPHPALLPPSHTSCDPLHGMAWKHHTGSHVVARTRTCSHLSSFLGLCFLRATLSAFSLTCTHSSQVCGSQPRQVQVLGFYWGWGFRFGSRSGGRGGPAVRSDHVCDHGGRRVLEGVQATAVLAGISGISGIHHPCLVLNLAGLHTKVVLKAPVIQARSRSDLRGHTFGVRLADR